MNNGTAVIVNSCFGGKMGFVDYLKKVFGLFKDNIKDLAIISILSQIPLMILAFLNLPAIIVQVIGVVVQIIYMISIIKLIDNRAKGNMISAIGAIKLVKENWLAASGAILLQALLFGVGGRIPFLPIIISVILAVSIPMGALQNKSILQSAADSFKLIKTQMIDVLAKLLLLSAISGILMFGLNLIYMAVPSTLLVVNILTSILATVQMISALVLFYNLPTVK
ncbi:hypothetical protein [uncultured Clostridium sp.]|jgi:hypothetical protein|uniref:hypothetical protein n=1 Tax=uncultured Clostridium sp. TaxID=59620 RepID=UPI0026242F6C|nr:hypothetical protein [uncultured Clostridium sp.]